MFFKKEEVSRRKFLKLASFVGITSALKVCSAASSYLACSRTNTGIRIVATVNPVGSAWAIQRSTDGGMRWVTLEDEGVVIGSGRIRWDVPMNTNESAGLFRLKLVTILKIESKNHRISANGQTLFVAMEDLRISDPSFSFVSEYRTDLESEFVTEINGVKGKWVFEVNGQRINDSVDVGSSRYIPQLGARIEWKQLP